MSQPPPERPPVTVLTTSFPGFPGDIAGHFVRSACEAVAAHGYQLTVVTPHARGTALHERDGALTVHRFRYGLPKGSQRLQWSMLRTSWLTCAMLPSYVAAFAAAARRHARGSWLLHAHWIPCALVARAAMLGRSRVPLVVSAWGSDAALVGRGRLGERLLRTLRAADAITVVGTPMKRLLADAGVPADRLHVVPSAVEKPALPEDSAAQARARLEIPAQPRVVLFLGRLSEEKGPDILLDALTALAPAQRPFVVFAGEGELRARLEQQAAVKGLTDRTRFAGFVPHGEIGWWLRAADVIALPSRSEGLPHALLEAMAAGLPAIASAVGSVPDVLRHGENGWLVPPADVPAWSAALAAVCRDEPLRRRLGETARADAHRDHVGYERMGRQLAAIYASVLGGGRT